MSNFKEQIINCVERIVAQRNRDERKRYQKLIDYVFDRLRVQFNRADTRANALLNNIAEIDLMKDRDINIEAYHKSVRARDAFRLALEILSESLIYCPPVQEDEKCDSDIYSEITLLADDFADMVQANEKKKANANKRAAAKRLRIRAAAKKSIKRK